MRIILGIIIICFSNCNSDIPKTETQIKTEVTKEIINRNTQHYQSVYLINEFSKDTIKDFQFAYYAYREMMVEPKDIKRWLNPKKDGRIELDTSVKNKQKGLYIHSKNKFLFPINVTRCLGRVVEVINEKSYQIPTFCIINLNVQQSAFQQHGHSFLEVATNINNTHRSMKFDSACSQIYLLNSNECFEFRVNGINAVKPHMYKEKFCFEFEKEHNIELK